MTDQTQKTEVETGDEVALNRRRLLKVAVATAPIIATLPSGAALARSSNLIGATTGSGKDALNRTLCLDRASADSDIDGILDLGAPPSGQLTAIRERDYRVDDSWGAAQISEKQMCQKGGQFYYRSNWDWKKVNVPKGIVASATALSSFAGSIYTTEV